jgi:hypothetical protein
MQRRIMCRLEDLKPRLTVAQPRAVGCTEKPGGVLGVGVGNECCQAFVTVPVASSPTLYSFQLASALPPGRSTALMLAGIQVR